VGSSVFSRLFFLQKMSLKPQTCLHMCGFEQIHAEIPPFGAKACTLPKRAVTLAGCKVAVALTITCFVLLYLNEYEGQKARVGQLDGIWPRGIAC
jgi:hypothetical protein